MQDPFKWTAPTGVLGRILEETYRRIARLVERKHAIEAAAREAAPVPAFAAALVRDSGCVAVIAEIKRASPSAGIIDKAISAASRAQQYETAGAAAISVLTEPIHFFGADGDLESARSKVTIPLLRKDFHVHPLQLLEARALGASAALLIVRAIRPGLLEELMRAAEDTGLEALVEVRTERELDQALSARANTIGVNARDLETLEVDASLPGRLLPMVPRDRVAVSESGIRGRADVVRLGHAGADAVLVGSMLSMSSDPSASVRMLTGVAREPRSPLRLE
ncbi:MAG: indole-3-glycerol-phosphate synthase [Gemmatimonadaceae bacterium]